MKLHLSLISILAITATQATAATYALPEVDFSQSSWHVAVSFYLDTETTFEPPLSVIAMGPKTGLTEIDNNFELLLNPDLTFTLNYCTEEGTSSATWDIESNGIGKTNSLSESGIYTVTLQGNSFVPGGTQFFAAEGNTLPGAAGTGDIIPISSTNLSAGFTFDEGTTMSEFSTDMELIAYEATGKDGAVTTVTIPEPTTATLSLLALAGLAARRRR